MPKKNRSNRSEKSGNTKQISPAKTWCFTYNNYPKNYCSLFSSNEHVFRWLCQEETGENGTPHLQGVLIFFHKKRPLSVFDTGDIHWEVCRNLTASIAYCTKDDTRSGRISGNLPYNEPIRVISDFYPWQDKIVRICDTQAHKRSIYWFWESEGGVGKSALTKYMCVNMNAIILSGKGTDMKHGIVTYADKNFGVYPKIIIIDIPRSNIDFVSYCAIEEIKNGCFFSGKYEGGMCVFNSPHIICFANSIPDISKMSLDRWKIMKIKSTEAVDDD